MVFTTNWHNLTSVKSGHLTQLSTESNKLTYWRTQTAWSPIQWVHCRILDSNAGAVSPFYWLTECTGQLQSQDSSSHWGFSVWMNMKLLLYLLLLLLLEYCFLILVCVCRFELLLTFHIDSTWHQFSRGNLDSFVSRLLTNMQHNLYLPICNIAVIILYNYSAVQCYCVNITYG